MHFRGMEDRLNPLPPDDADESTLGGYRAIHGRAAAFEGADGSAYTVEVETESSDQGDGRWSAYLVFLRWAETGGAIMGHVETDDVAHGATSEAARRAAEALPLVQVKQLLDATLQLKRSWEAGLTDDGEHNPPVAEG